MGVHGRRCGRAFGRRHREDRGCRRQPCANHPGHGLQALEINAAGFNIGEHFLSRFHNTRTDQYGIGSLEDRARFVTECIAKIKAACGDDFVVQMLIDCVEENDNLTNNATLMDLDNTLTAPSNLVITVEEGIEFAKLFEAAGCDSMHLRLGLWETTLSVRQRSVLHPERH